MNVEKAQLKRDITKRKQMQKEQEELCGPKLVHKIEKMLFEYNLQAGLIGRDGQRLDNTASEMKLLGSDADSVAFNRANNRNDNNEQHKKFIQMYGNEVK